MVMAAKSVTNGGHHPVSHTARYPHSAVESTLARTFYPKYASYMGDGTGRDSYVTVNNGGLTGLEKNHMMWRPSKVPHNGVNPRPFKPAPAHVYRSDGTGRDSYVVQNNGGLVADFRCNKPDVLFVGGLRQHQTSPLRNSNEKWRGPDGTDYLNWMTPKDQAAGRRAAKQQQELTRRLSPHKQHTKYANFTIDQAAETSGFFQSGKAKPGQARTLSHFERLAIAKQNVERRFQSRRRTEGNHSLNQETHQKFLDADINANVSASKVSSMMSRMQTAGLVRDRAYQTKQEMRPRNRVSGYNTPNIEGSISRPVPPTASQLTNQRQEFGQTIDPMAKTVFSRRSGSQMVGTVSSRNKCNDLVSQQRDILQQVGLSKLNQTKDIASLLSKNKAV